MVKGKSDIQKFWTQMTFDPHYISDLSLMTWMFPMSRKLKSMFEYVSSYSYPPPIACEEWGRRGRGEKGGRERGGKEEERRREGRRREGGKGGGEKEGVEKEGREEERRKRNGRRGGKKRTREEGKGRTKGRRVDKLG